MDGLLLLRQRGGRCPAFVEAPFNSSALLKHYNQGTSLMLPAAAASKMKRQRRQVLPRGREEGTLCTMWPQPP
eukprot:scaffold320115_cov15-Tisochrysis_lutea.AAC.1